jgi:hypothetical protein
VAGAVSDGDVSEAKMSTPSPVPEPETASATGRALAIVAIALGVVSFFVLFLMRVRQRAAGVDDALALPIAAAAAITLFAVLWLAADGFKRDALIKRWRENDSRLHLYAPLAAAGFLSALAYFLFFVETDEPRGHFRPALFTLVVEGTAMVIVGRHLAGRYGATSEASDAQVMRLFRRAYLVMWVPVFCHLIAIVGMGSDWWMLPAFGGRLGFEALMWSLGMMLAILYVVMVLGLAQVFPWPTALWRAALVILSRH